MAVKEQIKSEMLVDMCEQIADLGGVARKQNMMPLAYFLEMALAEAQDQLFALNREAD